MNNLLANFWSSQWFLVVLLLVVVVLMIVMSFTRKKKEDTYRNELNEKIVKGAHVKTYGGLYGTVVSVTETTDGKIVLLQTGEGDKVSYQQLHINAIYGIDDKQVVVLDENGNEVTEQGPVITEEKEQVKVEEDKPAAEPKKPRKKATKSKTE